MGQTVEGRLQKAPSFLWEFHFPNLAKIGHARLTMKYISLREAKTQLSRLVDRVRGGEELVITVKGRPAARLLPYRPLMKIREGGMTCHVPADFDSMFGSEIEAIFSGSRLEK